MGNPNKEILKTLYSLKLNRNIYLSTVNFEKQPALKRRCQKYFVLKLETTINDGVILIYKKEGEITNMKCVYHGSKEHNLKIIKPRKSTHGCYVYATTDKVLALHFSGRCGDDLTYEIGHFDTDKDGPWELVENFPEAFKKMYANSSSIYTLPKDSFKNIHTGFAEVVSEDEICVINEEVYNNVYDGLIEAEKEGLLKIYKYPNKPKSLKKDGSYILDKWRFYKDQLHKDFTKFDFDRLVYLHPELLDKINELILEFGLNFMYTPEDLVELFRIRVEKQLADFEHEQFIESAYINICNTYPQLKSKIDTIYYELINCNKEIKNIM